GRWTVNALLVGLAMGFATDNILVANNYRDRDEDRKNRKFTLIAMLGEPFGRYFYLINGAIAAGLAFAAGARAIRPVGAVGAFVIAAPIAYIICHRHTWRYLDKVRSGEKLNRVLAESARNLVVLAVMLTLEYAVAANAFMNGEF
ncbi:MAG: prenyltransferase, partial [Thermoguttaceae bacterium]|nr:prenyltransferase [Thermoguttaceae bacterium]